MLRMLSVAICVFLGLSSLTHAGSSNPSTSATARSVSFERRAALFGAIPGSTKPSPASAAATGGKTSVPYGWVDFCGRRPEECNVSPLPAAEVKLTAQTWTYLEHINRQVNASIEPMSNLEHWGTMMDHWDYPVDGKGDCKIYALYKRKLLLDAGFPRQALLMTIVRDLNDEGHTILTVKTDRGDFVLDNLAEDVRPWDATGYNFLKRQSQQNPNIWVSINLRGDASRASTASLQARN